MLQQDLQKAVDDLKRSVGLDGGSILARIQLGMAHHRLKQISEARSAFQAAEQTFPDSPDALNYHGEFLVESGDLAGATAKFEKAIKVSKGAFALAHVNLGVLQLHVQQDVVGAIARCQQAIDADALCETAHVHMAHLHLQVGDTPTPTLQPSEPRPQPSDPISSPLTLTHTHGAPLRAGQ